MQTLDEVIEDLDCLDDDNHKCDNCQWEKERFVCSRDQCVYLDAIYYLKEYKRVQNKIEKIALGNIEDTLDKLDNKPLTWDELKQMEGKPVWIEGSAFANRFWTIPFHFGDSGGDEYFFGIGIQYWKEYMRDADDGLSWQAYRKERK